jgi:2-C-methyl-D-erythritol 4-phosphate cytidylyltransferase
MNNKEYALIVAGGKGTRIKSKVPKQFLDLDGLPILMRTINAFYAYSPEITVIVVLPEDDFALWKELCLLHGYTKPLILQKGGETRFQSVKSGLNRIEGDGLVAIHDGVRPLVSKDIISDSFRLAAAHGSAVAAMHLKESIRIIEQEGDSDRREETTKAIDRSKFRLIQTPQTFTVSLIKSAYQTQDDPDFTDDATVAEHAGHTISLFEGSYENIKITTAEDLIIAEALLQARPR